MPVRASLTEIATKVRELVNDTDSAKFTDDQVEQALDAHRWEARYMPLQAIQSIASGGVSTYVTFCSEKPWTYWETNLVFVNSNYDVITSDLSADVDYFVGRWVFTSEPGRNVRVTGFSHDPYGAAADLLERRSAELSEELQTFSGANGSFGYANKRKGPSDSAAKYRVMARGSLGSAMLFRTDTRVR